MLSLLSDWIQFSRAAAAYSSVLNRRACTFISGKVCLLTSIEDKRQTLPEINMHARLFGTLEYISLFLFHIYLIFGIKSNLNNC